MVSIMWLYCNVFLFDSLSVCILFWLILILLIWVVKCILLLSLWIDVCIFFIMLMRWNVLMCGWFRYRMFLGVLVLMNLLSILWL